MTINNEVKTQGRKGDWIVTFTGKRFYPLDPRPEDIDISDVAHALSNQCRFIGHCNQFYAIAQHSVLVSMMCPPKDALWGLLHDASESYLADIPSPLKRLPEFEFYRIAERNLMDMICSTFGLDSVEPTSVSIADKRILATEARDLTLTEGRGWAQMMEPYDFNIKPWTSDYARIKFLSRFHELMIGKKT